MYLLNTSHYFIQRRPDSSPHFIHFKVAFSCQNVSNDGVPHQWPSLGKFSTRQCLKLAPQNVSFHLIYLRLCPKSFRFLMYPLPVIISFNSSPDSSPHFINFHTHDILWENFPPITYMLPRDQLLFFFFPCSSLQHPLLSETFDLSSQSSKPNNNYIQLHND